jgi:trk system potassium uptake protein TrkH
LVATLAIAINIFTATANLYATFGEALKHSFFQVSSISSTTGLSSANYDLWPEFSKAIIVLLTIVGACAGSTGGGMKVSRIIILCKSSASEFKRLIYPRAVVTTKFEGEVLDNKTERNVRTYFILWALIVALTTLLLTIDGQVDLFSNFTATLACVGNVGPGLGEIVGPAGNYASYSYFSKTLLSFAMLIGRLEIFPMLILFIPRTWRKG